LHFRESCRTLPDAGDTVFKHIVPAVPDQHAGRPAAVAGDYDDVSFSYELYVPCGCCQNVSIENVLPNSDAATVAVPVDVQNAILKIDPMRR
jgi:hypothetical protein